MCCSWGGERCADCAGTSTVGHGCARSATWLSRLGAAASCSSLSSCPAILPLFALFPSPLQLRRGDQWRGLAGRHTLATKVCLLVLACTMLYCGILLLNLPPFGGCPPSSDSAAARSPAGAGGQSHFFDPRRDTQSAGDGHDRDGAPGGRPRRSELATVPMGAPGLSLADVVVTRFRTLDYKGEHPVVFTFRAGVDMVSDKLVDGVWEPWLARLFDDVLARDPNTADGAVVDLGANLGAFTLHAASVGQRVVSFEMQPLVYTLLELSVRASGYSGHVTTHNMPLWDVAGVSMTFQPFRGNLGGTSLVPTASDKKKLAQEQAQAQAPKQRRHQQQQHGVRRGDGGGDDDGGAGGGGGGGQRPVVGAPVVTVTTATFDDVFTEDEIYFAKIDMESSEDHTIGYGRPMHRWFANKKVRPRVCGARARVCVSVHMRRCGGSWAHRGGLDGWVRRRAATGVWRWRVWAFSPLTGSHSPLVASISSVNSTVEGVKGFSVTFGRRQSTVWGVPVFCVCPGSSPRPRVPHQSTGAHAVLLRHGAEMPTERSTVHVLLDPRRCNRVRGRQERPRRRSRRAALRRRVLHGLVSTWRVLGPAQRALCWCLAVSLVVINCAVFVVVVNRSAVCRAPLCVAEYVAVRCRMHALRRCSTTTCPQVPFIITTTGGTAASFVVVPNCRHRHRLRCRRQPESVSVVTGNKRTTRELLSAPTPTSPQPMAGAHTATRARCKALRSTTSRAHLDLRGCGSHSTIFMALIPAFQLHLRHPILQGLATVGKCPLLFLTTIQSALYCQFRGWCRGRVHSAVAASGGGGVGLAFPLLHSGRTPTLRACGACAGQPPPWPLRCPCSVMSLLCDGERSFRTVYSEARVPHDGDSVGCAVGF